MGTGTESVARRTVRGLVRTGGRQILAGLAAIATFPALTRLLDTEELGTWMIIGQASFLIALADLGLTTVVQRAAVTADREHAHRMVGLALLVASVVTPPLALGALALVLLLAEGSGLSGGLVLGAASIALLGGIVGGLTGPLRGFVLARGAAMRVANARLAYALVFLAVVVTCFIAGLGILSPAIALLASRGVELFWIGLAARAVDPAIPLRPRWRVRRGEARGALRDGVAGFAIQMSSTLQTGIDVFVLGAFSSLGVVAGYRIGLRAPELSYQLGRQAVTPLLRQLGDQRERATTVRVGTGLFGGAMVAGMSALGIAGQPLLVLWLGDKAAGPVPAIALALTSFAMILLALMEVPGYVVMLGARSAWRGAVPVLLGASVNLVVSLAGVHTFGVWAVAGSTVLGYGVTGVLIWREASRMLGWGRRDLAAAFGPATAAAAISIPSAAALRDLAFSGPVASVLVCAGVASAGLLAAAGVARWIDTCLTPGGEVTQAGGWYQ